MEDLNKAIQNSNNTVVKIDNVTHVEVIDLGGRSYVNPNPNNKVSISVQDDGKTLKILIEP